MRLAVDTGGTFTDLVVEDDDGSLLFAKAPTTLHDPMAGILGALQKAAAEKGENIEQLLSRAELFIHGTTHAINAVVTQQMARTALLTTQGHEDVLCFREGGRADPFDYAQPRPKPYIPRQLTFGVRERILSDGRVALDFDEAHAVALMQQLKEAQIEAVAVCLLWSIVNPAHELKLRALLQQHLPNVPVTLSHELNPTMREYRRASATAIDASLKPVMTAYLETVEERLRGHGFAGRLLIVTSGGGVLDASALAQAPIHAINSGPAMAPVAARHYARRDAGVDTAIVGDVGGTTLDVALIRQGRIGRTREKWVGTRYIGHMTGFHSVDITSVPAGGGSIASVDSGGLLRVGPESAGASPGPACFGRGGTLPTVTDAHLALGRLDPDYFLAGAMKLDLPAAQRAIQDHVATPLGMTLDEAALAIANVSTENMVLAIENVTINQGVDPAHSVYVAAGGAAGFNAVSIGKRLGCPHVIIPESVATLSAAGALMSELIADFSIVHHASSSCFDQEGVMSAVAILERRANAFIATAGANACNARIELSFEARYDSQIWEIEVPFTAQMLAGDALTALREAFERLHDDLYSFQDSASELTFVQWNARAIYAVRNAPLEREKPVEETIAPQMRSIYMPGDGRIDAPVYRIDTMDRSACVKGPAILESPLTTIVLDRGATAMRNRFGSVIVTLDAA